MTVSFADVALVLSSSFIVALIAKATVVAALGLLSAAAAPRMRASRRHLVLASTFGVLLLLPLAAAVIPPHGIPVGAAPRAPLSVRAVHTMADQPVDSLLVRRAEEPGRPDTGRRRFSSVDPIVAVWAAGTVLALLPIVAMMWRVRVIRRTALPWTAAETLATSLAAGTAVRARLTVRRHDRLDVPMTCGCRRPVILLPRDAPSWGDDDLERALVHELEHVRRADWLLHIGARVVCALYWFHPLVWAMWRRFHLEAERACDDAVAARTDRTAYAEQLVTIARRLSAGTTRPMLAMAGRGDLARRVLAILDDDQVRGGAGGLAMATAAVAVVATLAAVAPIRAVSRVEQGIQTASAGSTFEAASIRRNLSGPPGPSGNFETTSVTPDGFHARNATLLSIVRMAYGVPAAREDLIAGGPDWVSEARFDITAKAGREVKREEALRMTRALLEERFNLVVRTAPRERDVFTLTVARSDGRLGPDLRQAAGDCAPVTSAALLGGGVRRTPGMTTCGTIAGLVEQLERELQTTVVDRTGLTGRFDYSLRYNSARSEVPPVPGLQPLPPERRPPADAPGISTALQEQLGLRLQRQRGTVDVLVIESAAWPSEN